VVEATSVDLNERRKSLESGSVRAKDPDAWVVVLRGDLRPATPSQARQDTSAH
jgi:hypothetical protein